MLWEAEAKMELREASCSMTLFPAAPGVCWRPKSYWQRVEPLHLALQRLCCFRSLRWPHWEPETLGYHLDLAFCLPWLASWPGGRLGSSTGWWPTTLLRDLQVLEGAFPSGIPHAVQVVGGREAGLWSEWWARSRQSWFYCSQEDGRRGVAAVADGCQWGYC